MGASAIREKLQEYIRIADDRKVKAIYTMVEKEIEEEYHWWKDEKFIVKLEREYEDFESGKMKGYSIEEVKKNVATAKRKMSGNE